MLAKLCDWGLKACGWQVIDELPKINKYVLIAAPHTSNWDFILGIMAKISVKAKLNYLGKGALFNPPFGWFFRMLGGIPVYRKLNLNMVDQMVAEFEKRDRLVLAISPEGTRTKRDYWKSGFYYIAIKAKVPIAMATLDFKNKTVFMGNVFTPCGEIEKDMEIIRKFYEKVEGKIPEKQGKIKLKNFTKH